MELKLDRARRIEGWSPLYELQFLAERAQTARVAVEIGTWKGRSARVIGDNLPRDGVLWCVDDWSGAYRELRERGRESVRAECCQNLSDLVEVGRVKLREWSTQDGVPGVLRDCEIDLLFVDGSHNYEDVRRDLENFSSLVRDDGIICGDDYNMSSVRRAVDGYVRNARNPHRKLWWALGGDTRL